MKTRRVLITGGAGFIGSHIAEQLAREKPRELVVYDNFSRGRRDNLAAAQAIYPVTIINGDVCDLKHLHHAMEDIDFVFHQACVSPIECLRNPRLAMDVLVAGTFNVLEAAVGASVSRVVTASPTLESGARLAVDKESSVHAAARRFSLDLLPRFAELYDLSYVTLRYDALYGPGMDMQSGLGAMLAGRMRNIEAGPRTIVQADTTEPMGLVHVRDLARAAVLATDDPITGQVLNASAEIRTSLEELAERLVRIVDGPDAPEQPAARFGTMQIGLDEGLGEVVHWWRQQGSEAEASYGDPTSAKATTAQTRGIAS